MCLKGKSLIFRLHGRNGKTLGESNMNLERQRLSGKGTRELEGGLRKSSPLLPDGALGCFHLE